MELAGHHSDMPVPAKILQGCGADFVKECSQVFAKNYNAKEKQRNGSSLVSNQVLDVLWGGTSTLKQHRSVFVCLKEAQEQYVELPRQEEM